MKFGNILLAASAFALTLPVQVAAQDENVVLVPVLHLVVAAVEVEAGPVRCLRCGGVVPYPRGVTRGGNLGEHAKRTHHAC